MLSDNYGNCFTAETVGIIQTIYTQFYHLPACRSDKSINTLSVRLSTYKSNLSKKNDTFMRKQNMFLCNNFTHCRSKGVFVTETCWHHNKLDFFKCIDVKADSQCSQNMTCAENGPKEGKIFVLSSHCSRFQKFFSSK